MKKHKPQDNLFWLYLNSDEGQTTLLGLVDAVWHLVQNQYGDYGAKHPAYEALMKYRGMDYEE